MVGTNGITISNSIVYNTYRSGLILSGTNNIVQNNLVTTVYWLGTGQIPSVAEFNFNNDAAIMTRDVNSIRLLVSSFCFLMTLLDVDFYILLFRIIWLLVLNV